MPKLSEEKEVLVVRRAQPGSTKIWTTSIEIMMNQRHVDLMGWELFTHGANPHNGTGSLMLTERIR